MKRLILIGMSAALTVSATTGAFAWGSVSGRYGGAAYRGPMGGAAVEGQAAAPLLWGLAEIPRIGRQGGEPTTGEPPIMGVAPITAGPRCIMVAPIMAVLLIRVLPPQLAWRLVSLSVQLLRRPIGHHPTIPRRLQSPAAIIPIQLVRSGFV